MFLEVFFNLGESMKLRGNVLAKFHQKTQLKHCAVKLQVMTAAGSYCSQVFVFFITSLNISETLFITDTHRVKPAHLLASILRINICKPNPFSYPNDNWYCSEQFQVLLRGSKERSFSLTNFKYSSFKHSLILQRFVTPRLKQHEQDFMLFYDKKELIQTFL